MTCPALINVLIGFEHTGALSRAFHDRGFNVTSCDLKPSPGLAWHFTGNVFDLSAASFDFAFFFPPCTYLCKAQLYRCVPGSNFEKLRDEAVETVSRLLDLPIPHMAIENPTGHLTKALRPPDQIIYPWYFGDPWTKEINLWLKDVPGIMSTCISPVRKPINNRVNGRMSQNLKSEIKSSWLHYPGMCNAIADQYGRFLQRNIDRHA